MVALSSLEPDSFGVLHDKARRTGEGMRHVGPDRSDPLIPSDLKERDLSKTCTKTLKCPFLCYDSDIYKCSVLRMALIFLPIMPSRLDRRKKKKTPRLRFNKRADNAIRLAHRDAQRCSLEVPNDHKIILPAVIRQFGSKYKAREILKNFLDTEVKVRPCCAPPKFSKLMNFRSNGK